MLPGARAAARPAQQRQKLLKMLNNYYTVVSTNTCTKICFDMALKISCEHYAQSDNLNFYLF